MHTSKKNRGRGSRKLWRERWRSGCTGRIMEEGGVLDRV